MRGLKLQAHLSLLLLAAGLLLGATPNRAEACSCIPPSIESSYHRHSHVMLVDPLGELAWRDQRLFLAAVQRSFKGCLAGGDLVLLATPASSAACGAILMPERTLVSGSQRGVLAGLPVLAIGLCDYNVPESGLSDADLAFLNSRTLCCGDECRCADGSEPVNCFVDPCEVAPPCPDGQCVANYCGGCNAEFYDDQGYAVCQTTGECREDADCPEGQWCRQAAPAEGAPADDIALECVPFVGEGESCNGFTVSWEYERCEPGLSCDTVDFVADAPGICRNPCEAGSDCAGDQYCATDQLCEADGRCELDVDCNDPDNAYIRPRCVGYGVCDRFESTCGWECGNPQCLDLSGVDFGACEAILGYAVVGGSCTAVSGCSAGDHALFSSMEDCDAACTAARGCYSDDDCQPGERCNAAEVCEPPPGCDAGEVCPAVCYGSCEPADCVPGETETIDACGNTCTCTADAQWVCTARPCEAECATDADCMRTGCSSHVCAAEPVITTCEFRPEYACYQDDAITQCGCQDGTCGFSQSEALARCLEDAGPATAPTE